MADFLDVLAKDAKKTVCKGYYKPLSQGTPLYASLKKAIVECKTAPIITEIKAASPSAGVIKNNIDAIELAQAMEKGGAVGLSVLTEPVHFNGSLSSLIKARKAVKLPILMKDIVISPMQIEAASQVGANVVLLIQALFDRGYCESCIEEMIKIAHSANLEVLLETHNESEFRSAITTNADLIGINNRNLATLKVDLNVTRLILKNNYDSGRIVVSESGVNTPDDLRFLRKSGAKAFLIGSAIMRSGNIEEKVKELVQA